MAAYSASADAATSLGSKSGSSQQPSVQEFSIRVPKSSKKKYNVMRFSANLGVSLQEWKNQAIQVKMERENNMKEFRGVEDDSAKFGAGSEYGKEAREEARRKKFGIISKKYRPDAQPWILKTGGKNGKKFKGIREGGVSDNTAYYVFTQAGKGVIEAYPLEEWYKFQPIQRYKALSAEEAEEEFGKRNKIINYFSVMMKKRLRNEDDGDDDDLDDKKGKKPSGKKKKDKSELKISEMDDWMDSDEDLSGSDSDGKKDDDDDDDGSGKKKKGKGKGKGKKAAPKKKKKKDSDDEAFEDSDDGDEEGRELDYISDSSESGSDTENKANKELKGVAEEDALRKLLNSESEDEDEKEENKEKDKNSDDEDKKKDGEKDEKEKSKADEKSSKKSASKKKPQEKKASGAKDDKEDSSSELSPNSSDSESDTATTKKTPHKTKDPNSAGSSRSSTPIPGEKRKLTNAESAVAAAKKAKLDSSAGSSSSYIAAGDTGVTEDAVRRYLLRKPMTTIELVQKFKSKKTGLTSEQLVNLIAQILKNINPVRQTIKNKMYLSLKPM